MKRLLIALLFVATAAQAADKSYYLSIVKFVRKDAMKTGFTEAEMRIMKAHRAYHASLTKEGVELVAGPTIEDDPLGIAIFSAASPEEAMAIMKRDPAVAAGIVTGTLHRFELAFGTAAAVRAAK